MKKAAKKLRQGEKKLAAKREVPAALLEEELRKHIKAESKQKKIHQEEVVLRDFIKTLKGVKYCDVEIGKGPVI